MVIRGSYIFECSASKDMENQHINDERRIQTHLLAYHLTLIVKEWKISVEEGRVVTILNIIKHMS